MKKTLITSLSILSLSAAIFGAVCASNNIVKTNAEANANGWDYSLEPTQDPADSMFKHCWDQPAKTMRLNDKATLASFKPQYGTRFEHRSAFDLTTLKYTVEMSHMSNMLTIMICSRSGGYYSEGSLLTMDILPAKANAIDGTSNSYRVTLCATPGRHELSIDGFDDGTKWADDSAFTGITVSPTDNRISVEFNKVDNTSTNVILNGETHTVANADLFANYTESSLDFNSEQYFLVGGMNGNGEEKVVFEEVTDAKHTAYMSSTGAFTQTKALLSELNAMSVTNASEAEAYLAKYANLRYSELYSYDKSYLATAYNSALAKFNTASTLSPTYLLKQKEAALTEATKSIVTTDDIKNAETALSDLQTAYDGVDVTSLTDDGKTYYDTIPGVISAATAKIGAVAKGFYTSAVTAYVSAVEAISSAATLIAAKEAYSAIPTSYAQYLTEDELAAETAKISTAKASYTSKTTVTSDNMFQGSRADVYKADNGELTILSNGSSNYKDKTGMGGVIFNKPVTSNNFEMKFSVDSLLDGNTWISFGVMEKAEMFYYEEDERVANNKGVFFLIQKSTATKLTVQTFVCTISATRFYDSKLVSTVDIPYQQDVTLSLKNVTKEIGGVQGNYYVIKFNDTEVGENITTNRMKTVFTDSTDAYVYAATSGSQAAYTIKTINGVAPLSDSLKPASLTPTSSDSNLSYTLGSGADLSFNLDAKNQTITSLKIGKKVIGTANYTYANNKVTIKGSALANLVEGEQTITLETTYGTITWKLNVVTGGNSDSSDSGNNSQASEDNNNNNNNNSGGGCGGSIIATGTVTSILALTGIGLAVYKKKKEDK